MTFSELWQRQIGAPEACDNAPRIRRTTLVAYRTAVLDLHGSEGLEAIAAVLPDDVRRDTLDAPLIIEPWLPEAYMVAWVEAAWEAVARRRPRDFNQLVDRATDYSIGRIRRNLLTGAEPAALAEHCTRSWRQQHTTGLLTCEKRPNTFAFTLRDHPYIIGPFACAMMAENIRYTLSLSSCSRVTVTHHRAGPEELRVRATWR